MQRKPATPLQSHTCLALALESMLIDMLLVLRVLFSTTDRHSHE